jgi:rSAM/selenodomain-associated transferase 1
MNQSHAHAAVVALFVRAPIPGRVKTRLASGMGKENSCLLYRAMADDVVRAARDSGLALDLFHDGAAAQAESLLPAPWRAAARQVIAQQGNDIGKRMAAAFHHCFSRGVNQTIVAGSDVPDLCAAVFAAADRALRDHEVVLAPTVDGGYGLIGLHRASWHPELFHNIPWSTDQVTPATLAAIKQLGLTVCLLEPLRDLDTVADVRSYARCPAPEALETNQTIARLAGDLCI